GTYAEKVLAKITNIYRLPSNVSFEQGAGISTPYATAFRALFDKAQVKSGETILVHGASGGVGLAAVQLAFSGLLEPKNLTVIGTAGTKEGMELVRKQGAQHVFNHKDPGYIDAILKATEGRGPNIILEMLANVNLDRDMDLIAKFGRIVVVGNRGSIEINPRKLMTKDSTITGIRLDNGSPKEIGFIHSTLYTGLMNETLVPIVHKTFPLSEAGKAQEAVLADGSMGKIILIP
ncbi:MAG: NADPH:quinone reductase, partial [Alphaproteobacteria bacterium]